MGSEGNNGFRIRKADSRDVDGIVTVTNRAYVVEDSMLRGRRTDAAEVRERMSSGQFLLAEEIRNPGVAAGSVFVSTSKRRGYLGMLAVDPSLQGRGIAGGLIKAVERECLREACLFLDITVLNLRKELFPFYRHYGFCPSAVLPHPRPELLIKPLHLVQMTKPLRSDDAL